MFSELEEQVAGFVTVGALLMDFFLLFVGYLSFVITVGVAWFGLVWFCELGSRGGFTFAVI